MFLLLFAIDSRVLRNYSKLLECQLKAINGHRVLHPMKYANNENALPWLTGLSTI